MADSAGVSEAQMAALELRLQRAERRARVWAVVAILGLGAWLPAMHALRVSGGLAPLDGRVAALEQGQVDQATLEVQKLTLVDAAHAVRAELAVVDGATALTLRAPDGTPRVVLSAGAEQGGLELSGEEGVRRARLGWTAADERAALELQDRAGHLRADLGAGEGRPALRLRNDLGVEVVGVP